MKQIKKILAHATRVLACAAMFLAPCFGGERATITGIISGYAIYTDDNSIVNLAVNEKTNELAMFQSKRAEVTGNLETHPSGSVVVFYVESFTILTIEKPGQKTAVSTTQPAATKNAGKDETH